MQICNCGDQDCFLCHDPNLEDSRHEEVEQPKKTEHPLINDLRAVWDKIPYEQKLMIVYGVQSETELTEIWETNLPDCPIGDIPDLIAHYEDIIEKSKKK